MNPTSGYHTYKNVLVMCMHIYKTTTLILCW